MATYRSHSDILNQWNVVLFWDLLPAIGEQWYIEMMFRKFSKHNIYVTMYGKLSEQHLIVSLFLNCGEKVQKCMKTMGHMFYFFLGPSHRDLRTMIQWNVFHTWRHVCYVWKIVGRSFQCSPIKGKRSRKGSQFHGLRILECDIG